MSPALRNKAAKILPTVETLTGFEAAMGVPARYGAHGLVHDNWELTAAVWGLFDGYKGRPKSPVNLPQGDYSATYNEAYSEGQRLSMAELPA